MKYTVLILFLFFAAGSFAQSVAINTDGSTGDASALLDVKSNTKGVLFPRMTKTQKNNITAPVAGLLVFQTGPDSAGFHYYNGSTWLWLEALENKVWKTSGNAGTDTSVNFIGTTDNMPLRFKQNNTLLGDWNYNNGTYFIGENAGKKNLFGSSNIAIGSHALTKSSSGSRNIAFGDSALAKNGFGSDNVAIGFYAGKDIVSNGSVFIGSQAGKSSTSAFNNFIGMWSGINNTGGGNNNFLGYRSGENNTTGFGNTAIGDAAMNFIKTGSQNTLLGYRSDVGDSFNDSAFTNATAVGALARADTSNAMVLGSINGVNGASANVNVAVGTTKPQAALHVSRGSYSGNLTIPSNRTLLVEDNTSSYIQLLHPTASESGILAGNTSTTVKSGIVFTADSSVNIRTGGNTNRIVVDETGKVGINSNFPQSKLDVGGSVGFGFRIVTASTTADENDHTIIISNTAAGAVTISLPLVTTVVRREYVIVNQTSSTQNTNFGYRDFTNTAVTAIPANSSITLQASDGSFWYRIR